MISIQLAQKPLHDAEESALAIFCEENVVLTNPIVTDLGQHFYQPLQKVIEQEKFNGSEQSSLLVCGQKEQKPKYIILIGIGDMQKATPTKKRENVRRALGILIRLAENHKITSIGLSLPDAQICGFTPEELIQEITATVMIAHYKFIDFITDQNNVQHQDVTLTLYGNAMHQKEFTVGLHHGERIAYAVNQARHWCDLPGNHITPSIFAQKTELLAASHDLQCTVITKNKMYEMGMGGLCAVSQGSIEEPKLVILEYNCGKKGVPTIGLVGKGITFDSGGLSLKPAQAMETMKDDMAGAAVVVSTIEAIAHLKPAINVVALAPLAENMPSGSATRPGDIIRFYNGKTAEVNNTDAEGRLILADALAYAVKHYKLDALIDLATLTGACSYALGPFYAGLMTQHEALVHQIMHASERSGDRVWPLPMDDQYKAAIKTANADMSNTGNERYRAGAITAAFFLKNFVGETPWAHLDIAGTAFNVPDTSYYRNGATGFGVRLLVDMLLHWK